MAEAAFSPGYSSEGGDDAKENYPHFNNQRQKDSSFNGSGDGFYKGLPTEFSSSRSYNERFTRRDYERLEQLVETHFNKKFSFKPPSDSWKLPDFGKMFQTPKWQIDQFQKVKNELNNVKNKLNGYNLDEWHKHTRSMNKAGEIQWKLRKEFDPEFVTQAWCKFYENVYSFPLVPQNAVETNLLYSVHLCEAPGAFITSLNHFLQLHYPDVEWDWIATTLNPYYEGNPLSCMINDDRFILQTLNNWDFGQDFTGNLMNLKNLHHLVKRTKDKKIYLVTADGSIDCQENPDEQEAHVSALHYCEAVSALHLLAPGGSFLLKMFTMYEQETICLMYLLNCAFEAVHVFKPATSKEGNSEVYVICLEYRGKEFLKPWLAELRKKFGCELPPEAMFPLESIPEEFLNQLYNCAQKFKNYQVDVIENNIRAFRKGRDAIIKKLRYLISNRFMEMYQMQKLDEGSEVVGKSKLKETQTLNLDPRTEEGSYDDRCKRKKMTPIEKLTCIEDDLINMNIQWPYEEDIKWLQFPHVVEGFKITTGKPVTTVHSCKFCLGRLLKMRNQVREIAQDIISTTPRTPSLTSTESQQSNSSKTKENPLIELLKSNPKGVTEMVVLDFKEELWSSVESGHNEEAELKAFETIKDTVEGLWRDQNLFIQGYPMLTQFNVGIIYMLGHMFSRVGFLKPDRQDFAVIFVGYLSWNQKMFKFLQEVDDTFDILADEGGNETVLAVMPINQLCGKHPDSVKETNSRKEPENNIEKYAESVCDFYTCVTETNHLCVKEQISDIIVNVRQ